jgi:hypothetical protein
MAGMLQKDCARMKGLLPCSNVWRWDVVSDLRGYEAICLNAETDVIVHVPRIERDRQTRFVRDAGRILSALIFGFLSSPSTFKHFEKDS